MDIAVKNESVFLGPEKYLYWPKESLLAIADLHLGRDCALQNKGIPLPYGADDEDLKNLALILDKHDPKIVVLLGDIFHSKIALSISTVLNLKDTLKSPNKVIAIVGNHDRGILKKFNGITKIFDYQESYQHGVFGFCHDYSNHLDPDFFWWSGHLHPRVSMKLGPESLKLPAFLIKEKSGILPAFSSLAMGFDVKKSLAYKRFVCAGEKVFEI